jgi:hypothetical protein
MPGVRRVVHLRGDSHYIKRCGASQERLPGALCVVATICHDTRGLQSTSPVVFDIINQVAAHDARKGRHAVRGVGKGWLARESAQDGGARGC